jgi:hypothetical protein
VTVRVAAAALAPDLRYGAAPALAAAGGAQAIGHVVIRAEGCLPLWGAVPTYLRYSDRNAVLCADGVAKEEELEGCLGDYVQALGRQRDLDDLSAAVVVLDAVDHCFRESGLWAGNIYLAAALDLAGIARPRSRAPEMVSRELAALELAYLFPVARKFRSGTDYDGQVQYRLNGWGRAVAMRLACSRAGADRAAACRRALSGHLAGHRHRYAAFLSQLEAGRPDPDGSRLEQALTLPVPVLA